LVGFSRGAFTARSVVGFISTVGLLTKRGMDHFYEVFKDYENMNVEDSPNVMKPGLAGKPKLRGGNNPDQKDSQEKYRQFLQNYKRPNSDISEPLAHKKMPHIKALGVWDTVGSLGVPGVQFFDEIKTLLKQEVYRAELQFYDTTLSEIVENAFQALALDEKRHPFTPSLWEKLEGDSTKMKQVWFPGVHSNIGGGMEDIEISDITLAWMMSQFHGFLDFDEDYILSTFALNKLKGNRRDWSCGNIDTTQNNPILKIAGDVIRTPGQYCQADNQTGVQETNPPKPLQNTHERIHPSVRIRLASKNGLGINDKGKYLAEALTVDDGWKTRVVNHITGEHLKRQGWKLVKNNPEDPVVWDNDFKDLDGGKPPATPLFYWKCENAETGFPNIFPEETLGIWEQRLWESQTGMKGLDAVVPHGWS
jgi:hypothetical protein